MHNSRNETTAQDGADHSTLPFRSLADLASSRLGGRALAASDDFFAPKSNLLKPEPPIFIAGKFTSRGKWMDGWESRRKRTPGHDWCVIRLGVRGRIRGVDVDTRFFTGNFPSHCSIDAIDARGALPPKQYAVEGAPWTPILPNTALRGDTNNVLAVDDDRAWTHVRLNIFPDGGVARLRVYGDVVVDWSRVPRGRLVDLAGLRQGGLVLGASDMHYGAKDNMLMPGRAINMGDGWETKRRRGPGHDWAVIRLGTTGVVRKVEIDTSHFKGNYPDTASLEGCLAPGALLDALGDADWSTILPPAKLQAHRRHVFQVNQATKSSAQGAGLALTGRVSHVRLNIFPDGGISRLRLYGIVAAD
jgi:allantoicase